MIIEHVAAYTQDLEKLKTFYETYFGAVSNEKYTNEKKGFSSYFLSFGDGDYKSCILDPDGNRIEITS